jgi:hypothetical protein
VSNFKKELHELEIKILAQINKRILDAGNTQRLSLVVYKNENTLRSILHRCEKSSPLKLVKLYLTLEQIDRAITKVGKKEKKKYDTQTIR